MPGSPSPVSGWPSFRVFPYSYVYHITTSIKIRVHVLPLVSCTRWYSRASPMRCCPRREGKQLHQQPRFLRHAVTIRRSGPPTKCVVRYYNVLIDAGQPARVRAERGPRCISARFTMELYLAHSLGCARVYRHAVPLEDPRYRQRGYTRQGSGPA